MKKILAGIVLLAFVLSSAACNAEKPINQEGSFMKDFNKVKAYDSNLPANYKYTDYKALSKSFMDIAFDFKADGIYLPLTWEDKTYDSVGIPAYVGDGRMEQDGSQEAVTVMAAVLRASKNGVDMTNYQGKDYISMLNAFYTADEGIILNNPDGNSAETSMWYLLYPTLLYAQISMMYEGQEEMRQNILSAIESWYDAYTIIRDTDMDFALTGFDFKKRTPYRNGVWTEPDCAVGMAILFHYGYMFTGQEKYNEAIVPLMDYIEEYFGGPLYEVLMYYAPSLLAKLNLESPGRYDISKALNRVFNGNSIPRGGWGSVSGKWGDYEINGLFGSTTDGGGYAFAMNTFAAAGAVAPLARYDTRYAAGIGKWLLHLHSNSRYFYANETNPENQSLSLYTGETPLSDRIINAIPYEGIRNHANGKAPWFGGDPTVYGWAETDFFLYSGAHTGVLGALFEQTDVGGILKTDLLVTDVLTENAYSTFLIYNPYEEDKQIRYQTSSSGTVDLFDAVTNNVVSEGAGTEAVLLIPAESARVIVEIPSGNEIERDRLNYYVDGRYISSDKSSACLLGANNNQAVSGKLNLTVALYSNFEDTIDKTVLLIDDKEFVFTDKITLDTKDFSKGSKQLEAQIFTKGGLTDKVVLRLLFE